MRTSTLFLAALFAAAVFGAACGGGGGEAGPAPGTPQWSWAAAVENQDAGDFAKAIEHLDNLAKGDSELKDRAIFWRAALQDGLAQSYQEIAEGYRLAMKAKPDLTSQYQNALQQAYRNGRQYSIAFAESIGDLDKALSAPSPKLDFPVPGGTAGKPAPMTALEKGEPLSASQLAMVQEAMVRRGVILAASRLAGKGDAPNEALAAFGAGPISLAVDQTRLGVTEMLLDLSVLFDRIRLHQPDIRKILVDRAETWCKPYLESENVDLKAKAEQLTKEIEDERLELDGKRRRLNVRGE